MYTTTTDQVTDYPSALKELIGIFLYEDKCEYDNRALWTGTAKLCEDEEQFGRRISVADYELR